MNGAQKHGWQCCKCVFFHEIESDAPSEVGRCRRYAPRPLLDVEVARLELRRQADVVLDDRITAAEAELYPVWPTVRGDHWCGEFRGG